MEPEKSKGVVSQVVTDEQNTPSVKEEEVERIDDLLDQLGNSLYLVCGYWQIRVGKPSRKKMTFITHHGLFEFCVMPFGPTNAPEVFQRLMQKVLSDLMKEILLKS